MGVADYMCSWSLESIQSAGWIAKSLGLTRDFVKAHLEMVKVQGWGSPSESVFRNRSRRRGHNGAIQSWAVSRCSVPDSLESLTISAVTFNIWATLRV
jgi:hypothetical protein